MVPGLAMARLGATPDEMVSRFGPETKGVVSCSGAVAYQKGDVTVCAWYDRGRVVRIRYVRDVPFDRSDVETLLRVNTTGMCGWAPASEATPRSAKARRSVDSGKWIRSDGAAEAQVSGAHLEVWSKVLCGPPAAPEKRKELKGF